jgi:hypothetical protein
MARVRVSLVGQMGWVGLAQTRYRAAINYFRSKNASAESVSTKDRANYSSDEWTIERLIRLRVGLIFGHRSNIKKSESDTTRLAAVERLIK